VRTTFFLPGEPDLAALARLDPDREPAEFRRGERAWVLQTYLRLRSAGFESELDERIPPDGLVLFHSKHEALVRRGLPARGAPVLVGIRADNREALTAEFELVQNGKFAKSGRRIWAPHWPQPGLVARDASRGASVRRVAYKGFLANLHPAFHGERWRSFLDRLGVEWVVDARPFESSTATDRAALDWSDFSAVDLILAVRMPDRKTDFSKPATKLVNAWLAGVPALLGKEYAFRELRHTELDYVEIDPHDPLVPAERAVERLAGDPELFRAMVENGRQRAREFDVAAVTSRWIELLGTTLPALAADSERARRRRQPLIRRRFRHFVERWREGRPPR